MMKYSALPSHRLTSWSYLMLPTSLILQKHLAWPTVLASIPHLYANMWLECHCIVGALSPSYLVVIEKTLSTIPFISASASSAVHTTFSFRQTDLKYHTLSFFVGQQFKFASSTKQKPNVCILSSEKLVLQWHVESVIIKILQEWENRPCGRVSFLIMMPLTFQGIKVMIYLEHDMTVPPFWKTATEFSVYSHQPSILPSSKPCQTLGTSDLFQTQGKTEK